MPQKRKITLAQLQKSLKSKNPSVRYNAIFDFAHSDVAADALPTLAAALKDESSAVVRYAAECLGKLGPAALSFGRPVLGCPAIMWELMLAAGKAQGEVSTMPQLYPHCLEALIKLDPQKEHSEWIVELIHNHIGLTNWDALKTSLQALRKIGTSEALDLLNRAATFWRPVLDKKQKRIVEEIVAGRYVSA